MQACQVSQIKLIQVEIPGVFNSDVDSKRIEEGEKTKARSELIDPQIDSSSRMIVFARATNDD